MIPIMLSHLEIHLFHKRTIKQVQWTLIAVIPHVVHIYFQRPVNSLRPEGYLAILFKQEI